MKDGDSKLREAGGSSSIFLQRRRRGRRPSDRHWNCFKGNVESRGGARMDYELN